MTDTDAGKRLSDARIREIQAFPIAGYDQVSDIFVPYVSVGKHDLDALCEIALSNITANRGSVDRIATIIQNSLGRHLSVDDDKEIDGTGPASYEAARAIQQAVSECSGGGAEEMREAAARIAETRGIDLEFCGSRSEAARQYGDDIAKAVRALPLPPSPVKESRDAVAHVDAIISDVKVLHQAVLRGYEQAIEELGREGDYRQEDWSAPYEFLKSELAKKTKSTPHQGGEGK